MNPRNSFKRLLAALEGAALDDARWPGAVRLIDEGCGATGKGARSRRPPRRRGR